MLLFYPPISKSSILFTHKKYPSNEWYLDNPNRLSTQWRKLGNRLIFVLFDCVCALFHLYGFECIGWTCAPWPEGGDGLVCDRTETMTTKKHIRNYFEWKVVWRITHSILEEKQLTIYTYNIYNIICVCIHIFVMSNSKASISVFGIKICEHCRCGNEKLMSDLLLLLLLCLPFEVFFFTYFIFRFLLHFNYGDFLSIHAIL